MTDETLSLRLQGLQTVNTRSLAARFREVYPAIEAALQAGNSRRVVHAELHDGGLFMSFNVFKKYLQASRALYPNTRFLTSRPAESNCSTVSNPGTSNASLPNYTN